jgi:hypothetical protein
MKNDSSFDPSSVIREMVSAARYNMSKNDTLYNLYWGYVSIFICLLVYITFSWFSDERVHFIWLLFVPAYIGGVYLRRKIQSENRVVTRLDKIFGQVWLAFSAAAAIAMISSLFLGWLVLPLFLILMMIPFMSLGLILELKVFTVGAVFLGMGAVYGFSSPQGLNQLVIYAVTMVIGYIIPSHIVRFRFQ